MKKLLLILLIINSYSCSKDKALETEINEIEINCNCTLNLVQVTINNQHLVKSSYNVELDCSDNGLVFSEIYNQDRMIQYKEYRCN